MSKPRRCIVSRIEEAQEGLVGIGSISHDAVGEKKLSRLRIKEGFARRNRLS
jgi:hypothetical protein